MLYLTIIGGAFLAWLILVVLFSPGIAYHIEAPVDARSEYFIQMLESTCHTKLRQGNKIDILTNGSAFYPAMLDAIRSAQETVNLECYIFKKGVIGDQFIAIRINLRNQNHSILIKPLCYFCVGSVLFCKHFCRMHDHLRCHYFTRMMHGV